MIYITEKPAIKSTGLTSLFISFDYNPQIVEILKSTKNFNYNKDSKEWECPLILLSFLLDKFVLIDSINFKLYKEEQVESQYNPTLQYKTTPFNYQLDAIKWGLNHDKWLLLDEAGLGKSLEMIYLAEELKTQKQAQCCLIVCGINALKSNWEKEINKHSRYNSIIIGQKISKKGRISYMSIPQRVEQLNNPIDEFFTIINIEMLRYEEIVEAINNKAYDIIFFDECHKAKGWSSKQGKNLMQLKAPYKVAATGTLIMNNPVDAYVPLVFINKEPLRSITKFKQTYCVYDENHMIVGYQNLNLLKAEIESCSLRRLKSEVFKSGTAQSLPDRHIINRYIDMNPAHCAFYYNVVKGIKESCDLINLKPNNLLAMVTRLRQATSCPHLLTTEEITPSKTDYALDLIEEIMGNGEKVVIFSSYKAPLYQLSKMIPSQYKYLINTGDTDEGTASSNIDKFQTDPQYKIFLGTVDKLGTGITLTAANNVIFLEQPWVEAIYSQACDRVYRIGQTKPVIIYNIICSGTIDEAVSSAITRKKAISKWIIDDEIEEEAYDILSNFIADL